MKKLFAIFFVMLIAISGCQSNLETKDLVGTWQVTDYDFSELNDLSPMIQAMAKEEALSTRYHLYQDQTFGVTSKFSADELQGNWNMTHDPDLLILFHPEISYPETIQLNQITKDSFIWTQLIRGEGEITFSVVRDQ